MSLLGALQVGKSALAVQQAALQVTGNNIANAGNADYTRQVANLAPSRDQQLQPGMFIVTGVDLTGIKRQIDEGLFGKLVNAEANISRDRLGKIDLGSWRYQAAGMPGGVMLQIGIHYTDVLEYLIGPVKAVSGQFTRLVLPGDNPDVASLVLEHENGALSTLNASYASASEYYLMNIYGKEATAYYDMFEGLRMLKRGEEKPVKVPFANKDTIAEELEEFADAVRGAGAPEIGGEYATTSLAVIRAGIVSAREGRHVEIAEILAKG